MASNKLRGLIHNCTVPINKAQYIKDFETNYIFQASFMLVFVDFTCMVSIICWNIQTTLPNKYNQLVIVHEIAIKSVYIRYVRLIEIATQETGGLHNQKVRKQLSIMCPRGVAIFVHLINAIASARRVLCNQSLEVCDAEPRGRLAG